MPTEEDLGPGTGVFLDLIVEETDGCLYVKLTDGKLLGRVEREQTVKLAKAILAWRCN